MKKVLFFALASLLVSISSCKKQGMQVVESSIVYTDEPPKELWGVNGVYKQTYQGFLNGKDLSEAANKGNFCNSYFNQSTGQPVFYDCGNYYFIPVHDYYGILGSKVYVSKSTRTAAIYGNMLLDVQDGIKRKESVIVYLCNSGCNNPTASMLVITGVQQ